MSDTQDVEALVARLESLADCDTRAGEPLGKCMREAATALRTLARERDEARAESYELKYAAAGGEDAPGSANAVTVADVARWQREGSIALQDATARASSLEAQLAGVGRRVRQQEEREPNGHRKNSCSEPGGNSRPLGEAGR